jgi:hypothetical protein
MPLVHVSTSQVVMHLGLKADSKQEGILRCHTLQGWNRVQGALNLY